MAANVSAAHPFPGLRPFGYDDREYYFGREDQVYALFRMLEFSRFIAVVGSSGSGKSSLVRAGLLPLLAQEARGSGGRAWRFATMQPGDKPIENLADALTSLGPQDEFVQLRAHAVREALGASSFGLSEALEEIPALDGACIMLVIDQFEEIFRYATPQSRERATLFVQLLLEGARMPARNVYILTTMRSDFIGDCAMFYGLPELVSRSQFLVPSLTRDQREQVITQPARKAGGEVEAQLVERLLNDSERELAELPVLQHTLAQVWEEARRRKTVKITATQQDYDAVGTITHALSKHADSIMAQLPGLDLTIEMVFRALSERDREGRATRRALPFGQLVAETGRPRAEVEAVVKRFREADCSFIVTAPPGEETISDSTLVDVGHEALLRRWDAISGTDAHPGWIDQEESDGRWLRALAALAGSES